MPRPMADLILPERQGACLGDTHMEGIGGLRRNEFMGFRAHEHVGGFDADDQIVVAYPPQSYELYPEHSPQYPLR